MLLAKETNLTFLNVPEMKSVLKTAVMVRMSVSSVKVVQDHPPVVMTRFKMVISDLLETGT